MRREGQTGGGGRGDPGWSLLISRPEVKCGEGI